MRVSTSRIEQFFCLFVEIVFELVNAHFDFGAYVVSIIRSRASRPIRFDLSRAQSHS